LNEFYTEPGNVPVPFKAGETYKTALERFGTIFPGNCGGKGICRACEIELVDRTFDFEGEVSHVQACRTLAVDGDRVSVIPMQISSGSKSLSLSFLPEPCGRLAVAVDIGTTIVALHLLERETGLLRGETAFLNPQAFAGADVMSRLAYASNVFNFPSLHRSICQAIADAIAELLKKSEYPPETPLDLLVAGNSAMLGFFLGIVDPHLGFAPHHSQLAGLGALKIAPEFIGMTAECDCRAVPVVSGFIGGDTVAAVMACGLADAVEPTLLIDFGSNCELVLASGGRLVATSCAAGPAFEGVGMSCGMPAVSGAVNRIDSYGIARTIGSFPVRGICGSGYLSLLYHFLKNGMVRPDGRISNEPAENSLTVVEGEYRRIYLDQSDVRRLQLAKAAVRTGISMLLKYLQLSEDTPLKIVLTGSFGAQIDANEATAIGLIPANTIASVHLVGSAASMGTLQALSRKDGIHQLELIASRIEVINLAEEADFQDNYLNYLTFDEADR